MKILLTILNIFGAITGSFGVPDKQDFWTWLKKLKIRNVLLLILIYGYGLHCIMTTLFLYKRYPKHLGFISTYFTAGCKLFICAISCTHFIWNQQRISMVLAEATEPFLSNPIITRRFKIKEMLYIIWFLVYAIILSALYIPVNKWTVIMDVRQEFYGWDIKNSNSFVFGLAAVMVSTSTTTYTLLATLPAYFLLVYILLCQMITRRIEIFTSVLESICRDSREPSRTILRTLKFAHTQTYALVKSVDMLYNKMVFVWYFDSFTRILYYISFFISFFGDNGSLVAKTINLLLTLYYVLFFTSLSTSAARVTEGMKYNLALVCRVVDLCPVDALSLSLESLHLLTLVKNAKLHLTAWNFFPITNRVILTFCGLMFSYACVVIKFVPEF